MHSVIYWSVQDRPELMIPLSPNHDITTAHLVIRHGNKTAISLDDESSALFDAHWYSACLCWCQLMGDVVISFTSKDISYSYVSLLLQHSFFSYLVDCLTLHLYQCPEFPTPFLLFYLRIINNSLSSPIPSSNLCKFLFTTIIFIVFFFNINSIFYIKILTYFLTSVHSIVPPAWAVTTTHNPVSPTAHGVSYHSWPVPSVLTATNSAWMWHSPQTIASLCPNFWFW